jgi:hypothetical protein
MKHRRIVCIRCKRWPVFPGRVQCNGCIERERERYDRLVAAGICVGCKTHPAVGGAVVIHRDRDENGSRRYAYARDRYCSSCQCKRRAKKAALVASGFCVTCHNPHSNTTAECSACLANAKARRQKMRDEVFAAYGGYRCACCDETEPVFLEIDHIDGGGRAERKALGKYGGQNFYHWLHRNGCPPGYRVLCSNCNIAIHLLGTCPHQLSKEAPQCPRSLIANGDGVK